ncbi:hypothetical protein FI667_g15278, partial [Globisporangium splendens]
MRHDTTVQQVVCRESSKAERSTNCALLLRLLFMSATEDDSPNRGISGGVVVSLVAGAATLVAIVAAAVLNKRKSNAQVMDMRELELSPRKA